MTAAPTAGKNAPTSTPPSSRMLIAAFHGLSFWRTCLPVALAVPLTAALCMYGGAVIAAQQAANLVVGGDDLHGGVSHLTVRIEVR